MQNILNDAGHTLRATADLLGQQAAELAAVGVATRLSAQNADTNADDIAGSLDPDFPALAGVPELALAAEAQRACVNALRAYGACLNDLSAVLMDSAVRLDSARYAIVGSAEPMPPATPPEPSPLPAYEEIQAEGDGWQEESALDESVGKIIDDAAAEHIAAEDEYPDLAPPETPAAPEATGSEEGGKWLDQAPDREAVLGAMRAVRAKADQLTAESQKLAPRYGELATGGEHFDHFVKSESLSTFLSGLSKGLTPQEAAEEAKRGARDAVAKWNKSPQAASLGIGARHHLHRYEGMADSLLDDAMRQVLRAGGQTPEPGDEMTEPITETDQRCPGCGELLAYPGELEAGQCRDCQDDVAAGRVAGSWHPNHNGPGALLTADPEDDTPEAAREEKPRGKGKGASKKGKARSPRGKRQRD